MRRLYSVVLPALIACGCLLHPAALGQQKLAQTGMKFLNITLDARAASFGEAFTAVDGNAATLFFNPAMIASTPAFASASLGQVKWIADIKHNYASLSLRPWDGEYGDLGLMVQTVDYGELIGTIRSGTGYQDIGTFNPKATMLGVAYARKLSDKFQVGAAAKWVHQNLGRGIIGLGGETGYLSASNVAEVYAFDFGILYRTGFKSLQFGMAVRNFSKEARYIGEGFQLPLTFRIGLSMNMLDIWSIDRTDHQFLLAVDAEHPRDYPERLKMGGEYVFMDLLALRAGFISLADEQKFSYGVGLRKDLGPVGFGLDYAYTPFGLFGNVNTFSFNFSF
jgi:hypothetical protein